MYSCFIDAEADLSDCITEENTRCVFPFTFNGKTYTACTDVDSSTFWCATKTLSSGELIEWGTCTEECQRQEKEQKKCTQSNGQVYKSSTSFLLTNAGKI